MSALRVGTRVAGSTSMRTKRNHQEDERRPRRLDREIIVAGTRLDWATLLGPLVCSQGRQPLGPERIRKDLHRAPTGRRYLQYGNDFRRPVGAQISFIFARHSSGVGTPGYRPAPPSWAGKTFPEYPLS